MQVCRADLVKTKCCIVQETSLNVVKRTLGDGRTGATQDTTLLPEEDCRTYFGNAFVIVGPTEVRAAAQAASVWIRHLSRGGFGFATGRPENNGTPYPHLFRNHEQLIWDPSVTALLQPNQHLFEFPIMTSGTSYAGVSCILLKPFICFITNQLHRGTLVQIALLQLITDRTETT
jgi:hypothetical protein